MCMVHSDSPGGREERRGLNPNGRWEKGKEVRPSVLKGSCNEHPRPRVLGEEEVGR